MAAHPPGKAATIETRFAVVSENTAATNTIVAAVTGFKIVVDSVVLVCTLANTVNWENGVTDISGVMSFGATGGYAVSGGNLMETATGAVLALTLGSAALVSGHISYHLE